MLESAHTINIWVHVVFGGLALLLGLVPLLTVKGGPRHRRIGGYFVACLSVVLVTATTGLLIFSFRAFLAVITMLSAYHAYSGLRALKNKAAGPTLQDGVVSCVGLAAALLFLVYIHSVKVPWVPVVIYSTLGALIAVTVYDLAALQPDPAFGPGHDRDGRVHAVLQPEETVRGRARTRLESRRRLEASAEIRLTAVMWAGVPV